MEQRLQTIRDIKYEFQEMMIDILGEQVDVKKQKTERYQELTD